MCILIALVSDRWAPRGGGRERYLAQLAEFLIEREQRVRVFCRTAGSREHRASGAIEIQAFPGPTAIGEPALGRALARFAAEHPDAPILAARPQAAASHYQLHSGILRDAFAGERASFSSPLRRALYWPLLRLNARRVWLLREERRVLGARSPARLMTFSSALARELREHWHVAPERVSVCSPGVDLGVFSPAPTAVDGELSSLRPYFLFVGHNYQLKVLWPALVALAAVQRDHGATGLLVAGRGHAALWQRRAGRLGLQRAPIFAGDIDPTRLAALYRGAVALVHPAFFDPYPRVVPEALACGCPVITTAACGAAECIEPGGSGIVLERAGDAAALARAMTALLGEGVRVAMGAAAAASRSRLGLHDHFEAVVRWLAIGERGRAQRGAGGARVS